MIDPRKTKAETEYQATPKRRMKCAICAQFVHPDMCKAIKGPIGASGWCKLYSSRRKASL